MRAWGGGGKGPPDDVEASGGERGVVTEKARGSESPPPPRGSGAVICVALGQMPPGGRRRSPRSTGAGVQESGLSRRGHSLGAVEMALAHLPLAVPSRCWCRECPQEEARGLDQQGGPRLPAEPCQSQSRTCCEERGVQHPDLPVVLLLGGVSHPTAPA